MEGDGGALGKLPPAAGERDEPGATAAGRWRGFRLRLLLTLLACAFLPVVVTGALALRLAGDSLTRSAVRRHQDLLDAVTAAASLLTDQQQARLERLARAPELGAGDPARIQPLLQEFLAESAFFQRLDLFTASQAWLAGAQRGGQAAADLLGLADPGFGAPPALRLRLGKVWPRLRAGGFPVRWAEEGVGGRQLLWLAPVARFAVPEELVGGLVAIARLDGPEIQDLLAAFPARADEYVCVLDGEGRIVAGRGRHLPATARGFDLSRAVLASLAVASEPLTVDCSRGEGEPADLVSLSVCPALGGIVALGQPAAGAFAPVEALRGNLLTIMVLTGLLALLAAAVLAWSIARPIRAFIAGLLAVTDGVYAHRVPVQGDDELAAAGSALNRLAAMLQRRVAIGSIWERLRG